MTSTPLSRFFPPPQVIQHGACLGLGIAALGTEDEEAFEDVKNVLYMDSAGGRRCAAGFASGGGGMV